jgi:hypothetical protein
MCQITVVNLHNRIMNEKLWMLLGTLGSSTKHDDGWGVADKDGNYFKCGIPMHYTTNAGLKIGETVQSDSILLGHVRDASAAVPVNTKNAHPFQLENITFVHNGKLTPKSDAGFILKEMVPDIDSKTGKAYEKDGVPQEKEVSRSDSLVFFEEFIRDWKAEETVFETQDAKFVSVVNKTMLKFYGKFAMVFILNGTFYICRGKQAELNITYFRESELIDSPVTGWAINTDRATLDSAVVLLNNLGALEGQPELHFTYPELLTEETIFVAGDTGITEIGKMKEGYAPLPPVKAHQAQAWPTAKPSNFTKPGETEDDLTRITRKIYDFMEAHNLAPQDIQLMLYKCFGTSSYEVTLDMLEIFHTEVLMRLRNMTTSKIAKKVRKQHTGFVGWYQYSTLNYPWMLNDKGDQKKLASTK